MNDFNRKYRLKAQMEFGKIKREIDEKKDTFKSTNWTDEKLMIEAANEIWALESRLSDALEIHKIIMDGLGETGEK